MDMMEMIFLVNELDPHRTIRYRISLEQLPSQLKIFYPDEYPMRETPCQIDEYVFYDKDTTMGFLFEKDLFGWQVK